MTEQAKILHFLFALLGGTCFAIVYRIPRRYFAHAALLAMLAKITITLIGQKSHIAFATFLTSLAIAVLSHLFARSTGKPAQAFLIPGVMYLVPGTPLYKAFSAALASDFQTMSQSLVLTITVTASISFALLLANWVVPSKRTL
jgi:uncharacterized membrane protein YjjB (DUF3815 family)